MGRIKNAPTKGCIKDLNPDEIMRLGGLGLNATQIAMFFDVDYARFVDQWGHLVEQGLLDTRVKLRLRLLQRALTDTKDTKALVFALQNLDQMVSRTEQSNKTEVTVTQLDLTTPVLLDRIAELQKKLNYVKDDILEGQVIEQEVQAETN